jgi:hypothetical protein
MRLPLKSPELVSVFIEAATNQKVFFLTIRMQKMFKTIGAFTESTG